MCKLLLRLPVLAPAMLLLCLLLGGCVSTVVGAAASGVVSVASAVVTAPIKIGKAVVNVVSDDDEDDNQKVDK